jgi:hypothetical protein
MRQFMRAIGRDPPIGPESPYSVILLHEGSSMSRLPFQCIRLLCLAAAATAFYPLSAARAESVSFAPLPPVPFDYAVEPAPYGIDGSRVVGTYYNDDDGEDYGFYYDGSNYTDLGIYQYAYGISGNTIVGENYDTDQAFTYDIPTAQFQFVSRPGAIRTIFNAIDGSKIVGQSVMSLVSGWDSWLYDGTDYTSIDASGLFGGAGKTYATAISGDFVGGRFNKASGPFSLPAVPFTYQISTGQYSQVVLPAAFNVDPNWNTTLTGISDQLMVGTYRSSVDDQDYIWLFDRAAGQFSSESVTDAIQNGRTGGASGNNFVGYADDLNYDQFAYVATFTPTSVPEIDPAGVGSVLALVTGCLGLLERRRLQAKVAA